MYDNNRPKPEFTLVHTIAGPNDTEIRITKAGDIRPMYSTQLGRRKKIPDELNRLTPFIPVRVTVEDGELKVDRSGEDLQRQANEWILADAKNHEEGFKTPPRQPRSNDRSSGYNDRPQGYSDDRRGRGAPRNPGRGDRRFRNED